MAADSQGKQEETSMKVAVVTDSNSGITQAQAKEMGVYVLPMPFMIDGTEYLEDINLTQKEFYEHLSGDHDVSTSQPSPETILNLWEKLLEEYDAVVHIPMSSGLSSSCQTAKMLADDFDGKVQVADRSKAPRCVRAQCRSMHSSRCRTCSATLPPFVPRRRDAVSMSWSPATTPRFRSPLLRLSSRTSNF